MSSKLGPVLHIGEELVELSKKRKDAQKGRENKDTTDHETRIKTESDLKAAENAFKAERSSEEEYEEPFDAIPRSSQ